MCRKLHTPTRGRAATGDTTAGQVYVSVPYPNSRLIEIDLSAFNGNAASAPIVGSLRSSGGVIIDEIAIGGPAFNHFKYWTKLPGCGMSIQFVPRATIVGATTVINLAVTGWDEGE